MLSKPLTFAPNSEQTLLWKTEKKDLQKNVILKVQKSWMIFNHQDFPPVDNLFRRNFDQIRLGRSRHLRCQYH